MANIERIKRLADLLDSIKPEKFDLMVYAHDSKTDQEVNPEDMNPHQCGTIGCIAGWALWQAAKDGWQLGPNQVVNYSIFDRARHYLEISDDYATELFIGRWHRTYSQGWGIPKGVKPTEAAAELRKQFLQK